MSTGYVLGAIAVLALMSLASRCFFFFSRRELEMPDVLQRGLRYAPLAALAAVIGPEVLIQHGHWALGWHQPRLHATAAATLYFLWRRDLLGTIVVGTAVLVALQTAWPH
jgi:branched-subunit amino acid transport protein